MLSLTEGYHRQGQMNQEAEGGGGWYKSENVTECHHRKLLQAHEIFLDVLYVIGYFLYLSRK